MVIYQYCADEWSSIQKKHMDTPWASTPPPTLYIEICQSSSASLIFIQVNNLDTP